MGDTGERSVAGVRVFLVGICGPDSSMLKRVVESAVPGVKVERLLEKRRLAELRPADVVLVNRVAEGDFETSSGVELIRAISKVGAEGGAGARGGGPGGAPIAMLVSNYPGSQAEAEAAGAAPGFGKARAGSPEVAALIRGAVASAAARAGAGG